MAMQGADAAQLRQLAKQFDAGALEIKQISTRLTSQINATHAWKGADSGRFKTEWSGAHRMETLKAAEALTAGSKELVKNADEQQQASDGATGSAGGGGIPTGIKIAAGATGGLAGVMAAVLMGWEIKGHVESAMDAGGLIKALHKGAPTADIFKGERTSKFAEKIVNGTGKFANTLKEGSGARLLGWADKAGGFVGKLGLAGGVLGGA